MSTLHLLVGDQPVESLTDAIARVSVPAGTAAKEGRGELALEHRDPQAQAGRLQLDAEHPGLVREATADGDDLYRVCWRHQWCSLPLTDLGLALAEQCPLCAAEIEVVPGLRRYAVLHARLQA